MKQYLGKIRTTVTRRVDLGQVRLEGRGPARTGFCHPGFMTGRGTGRVRERFQTRKHLRLVDQLDVRDQGRERGVKDDGFNISGLSHRRILSLLRESARD